MYNHDLLMERLYGDQRQESMENEIIMPSEVLKEDMVQMQMNSLNMMPKENLEEVNLNHSLANPKDAYQKGNLFKHLYSPYKDYEPAVLKPKDEKEMLLMDLSELSFAAHELNLYLNIHPEDESMIVLFNDYRKRTNILTEEYEKRFGPLHIGSNALYNTPWMWSVQNFPWEGSDQNV